MRSSTGKLAEPAIREAHQVYNIIFKNIGSQKRFLDDVCAGVPAPVEFKSAEQFKNDYLKWIKLYQ